MQEMQETQVQFLGGNMPWRRKWQPTPVFLPGEFHEQRSRAGYSPRGHKESDRTEYALTSLTAEPKLFSTGYHGLYSPWGCKESDTPEQLSLSLHCHRTGSKACLAICPQTDADRLRWDPDHLRPHSVPSAWEAVGCELGPSARRMTGSAEGPQEPCWPLHGAGSRPGGALEGRGRVGNLCSYPEKLNNEPGSSCLCSQSGSTGWGARGGSRAQESGAPAEMEGALGLGGWVGVGGWALPSSGSGVKSTAAGQRSPEVCLVKTPALVSSWPWAI